MTLSDCVATAFVVAGVMREPSRRSLLVAIEL